MHRRFSPMRGVLKHKKKSIFDKCFHDMLPLGGSLERCCGLLLVWRPEQRPLLCNSLTFAARPSSKHQKDRHLGVMWSFFPVDSPPRVVDGQPTETDGKGTSAISWQVSSSKLSSTLTP